MSLSRVILFIVLAAAGCVPDKEPLIHFQDIDKSRGSNIHKDEKPMYREVTDEMGLKKGWKF
jgi:hypothetical protein